MKKVLSLFLVLVLLFSCFATSVSAKGNIVVMGQMRSKKLHGASDINHKQTAEEILSKYVDLSIFTSSIMSGVTDCQEKINVSAYNIPVFAFDTITDYFFYAVPEAFNINEMGYSYYDGVNTIVSIYIAYSPFADTADEYDECFGKMSSAAYKILSGIEDNSKLDEVQKALLIHDRLALWNEYDYDRLNTNANEIYTAYGALGERHSVCQGYAMAYIYLLDRVGIESYYCSSDTLNHGWNIVYINNKPYHVDVTWDDMDWGINDDGLVGAVGHTNFLRSSQGIYATGHEAFDFDFSPVDKTYDAYFWQNSNSAFQYLNDEIYYIDHKSKEIKNYGSKTAIYKFNKDWLHYLNDGRYYNFDNWSMLASDGESLLYSMPNGVYKYDVISGNITNVYDARLNGNFSIYGMALEDGYLICDINDAPPNYYGFNYANKYQVKEKYENTAPRAIGIEIATKPNKTVYIVDEEMEIDGLTINLVYGDATKETITEGFTVSGFESNSAGDKIVTVYYGDFSATFVVKVNNKYGDANGDGNINARDYSMLIQHLNGWSVAIDTDAADVNNDGKVNARDYSMLIQYLNGWSVTLGPK